MFVGEDEIAGIGVAAMDEEVAADYYWLAVGR